MNKEIKNDNGEILIYNTEDGLTKIDVHFVDETVWLSQQQMSDLFQTSRTNVVEHIKNIYEEEELDENSTCRKFRQVELSSGSPSSYICFMCSTTFVLEVLYNSAICC